MSKRKRRTTATPVPVSEPPTVSVASPVAERPPDSPGEPQKSWVDKLGSVLPVGLAALATVFVGMSANALQRSMYWKSQAAQDQSKATNQWSLAGFKRDRSMIMETAAAQLRASCGYTVASFCPEIESSESTEYRQALSWLVNNDKVTGGPPEVTLPKVTDAKINALIQGIRERRSEGELEKLAARVEIETINRTLEEAEQSNARLEAAWDPILKAAADLVSRDEIEPHVRTARQAALYDMERRRYRIESRLNQGLGFLYEVRVRVSSAESDKYYLRSDRLSYAMFVAQAGVVIASLALARKQGSVLWLFAALVGVVALGFGGYAIGIFALLASLAQ